MESHIDMVQDVAVHEHHVYQPSWDIDHQGIEFEVVSAKWFGRACEGQWGATTDRRVDWSNATVKVSLHTSSFTPDQDAHDFWDDTGATEVSSANYTAGGQAITSKTVSYDTGTNETRLDGSDASWTTVTFTASYGVVYVDTAGDSTTDPVQVWVDFGQEESVSSGNFGLTWDSTGIAKVTAA